MAVIDGVFLNESIKEENFKKTKQILNSFLNYILRYISTKLFNNLFTYQKESMNLIDNQYFGLDPFLIKKFSDLNERKINFVFNTNTMKENIIKIFRGLSIKRPILVEGSPGVGKTTLIQNLAKKLGKNIIRINLSENTDMIDLIGSEYPSMSNSSKGLRFKWIDGAFLKALKNGDWVIIDEMNLASQSILEGLNSVLDHRKTLYVNELNLSFKSHDDFQIFATQNPVIQGGGRKFLPKSFLNRFVKIYLSDLNTDDYIDILTNLYTNLPREFIPKLIDFNFFCQNLIYQMRISIGEIGEYNLRTMMKVCEYLNSKTDNHKLHETNIINLLYLKRIRSKEVYTIVKSQYAKVFLNDSILNHDNNINVRFDSILINDSILKRKYGFPILEREFMNIHNRNKRFFNSFSICIENSFPMIITGDTGVGKKEIIRQLAYLTNNKVVEVGLNSSIDTTELLGNFDKINLNYHIKSIKEDLGILKDQMLYSKSLFVDHYNSLNILEHSISRLTSNNSQQDILSLINELDNHLNQLSGIMADKNLLLLISSIREKLNVMKVTQDLIFSNIFSFEWHDSLLIKSIEKGYWMILDNVNCCPSSLLDRLNSLLDDDRNIYLNECGLINNKERFITPHKDFRIFMIMNPKFGEVSRALKNRCVEVHIPQNYRINVSLSNQIDLINSKDQFFSPSIDFNQTNQTYFKICFSFKSFQNSCNVFNLTIDIKQYIIQDFLQFSELYLNENYQNRIKIILLFLIYNSIFSSEITQKETQNKQFVNIRKFTNYLKCINFHYKNSFNMIDNIIKTYSTIYNEDNLVSNIILQRSFIEETLNKITDEFSKINDLKFNLSLMIYKLTYNLNIEKSICRHVYLDPDTKLNENNNITQRIFNEIMQNSQFYFSLNEKLNTIIKSNINELQDKRSKHLLNKKRDYKCQNNKILNSLRDILLNLCGNILGSNDLFLKCFSEEESFDFNQFLIDYTRNKEISENSIEIIKQKVFLIYLSSFKENNLPFTEIENKIENDDELREIFIKLKQEKMNPKKVFLKYIFGLHIRRNQKNYESLKHIYLRLNSLINETNHLYDDMISFLLFIELIFKNDLELSFSLNKHYFYEVINYIFYCKLLGENQLKPSFPFESIWKDGIFYQNPYFVDADSYKAFSTLQNYLFLRNLNLSLPLNEDGTKSISVEPMLLLNISEDIVSAYQHKLLYLNSREPHDIEQLLVSSLRHINSVKAMKINFELKLTSITDEVFTPTALNELLNCGIVSNNTNQDNFLPIICNRDDFIKVEKFINAIIKYYTNLYDNKSLNIYEITTVLIQEELLKRGLNYKFIQRGDHQLKTVMALKLLDKTVKSCHLSQFFYFLLLSDVNNSDSLKNITYSDFDNAILNGNSDKLIFLPFLFFYLNNIKESLSKKFKQLLKSKTSLEENLNLILHQVVNLLFELLKEEHKIKLGQVLIIREDDILLSSIFACHRSKIQSIALFTQKSYSLLNFVSITSSSLMKILSYDEYYSYLNLLKSQNYYHLLIEFLMSSYKNHYFSEVFKETEIKNFMTKLNKTQDKLDKYSNKKIFRGNNIGSFLKDFILLNEELSKISSNWIDFLNFEELKKILINKENIDYHGLLIYLNEIKQNIRSAKLYINSFSNKYLEFFDDIILIYCNCSIIFLLSFSLMVKRIERVCLKQFKTLNNDKSVQFLNNIDHIIEVIINRNANLSKEANLIKLLTINDLYLMHLKSNIEETGIIPIFTDFLSEKTKIYIELQTKIFPHDKQENNTILFLQKETIILKEIVIKPKEFVSIIKVLLEISQKYIYENEEKNIESSQSRSIVMNFSERIKKYENLSMKVVENTKTMDEMTKEENDDFKKEHEMQEIEENFPTYKDEFNNFNRIEVMESLQHTRNLSKYLVF